MSSPPSVPHPTGPLNANDPPPTDDHPLPIVLGLDPGTATLGFAVVADRGRGNLYLVEAGAIVTSPDQPIAERLTRLHEGVLEVIGCCGPTESAIERLFFSRNVTSALAVGQARGAVILAVAQSGLSIAEYTPAEIKQSVTSYGNADKRQVQEMVRILLRLTAAPRPDDVADAAAIAICHHHSRRLTRLVAGGR